VTKLPKRKPGVLEQAFEEGNCSALTMGLLGAFHSPQVAEGFAPRILSVHSHTEIVVDMHLQMTLKLGGEVLLLLLTGNDADESE
jgi:hypothetical protein